MDPYTVSEREEQAFWDKFWSEYEKYPPGTRFKQKEGGTLVKMAHDRRHGITENHMLALGTGMIFEAADMFCYPVNPGDWEILSSTGEPYQH